MPFYLKNGIHNGYNVYKGAVHVSILIVRDGTSSGELDKPMAGTLENRR
jgi:hypothetical protein